MKSVIAQHDSDARSVASEEPVRVLVVSDDLPSATDLASSDPDLLWNPDAVGVVGSTCSWDLLGAVTDAPAADRITEHLLRPVLDNRLATFFLPEASLLTANMLLAASRTGLPFGAVLGWVGSENTADAAHALRETGEIDAYEDVLAFDAQDELTQGSVWETMQMALTPLATDTVFDALSRPGSGRRNAPAPFGTLHGPAGASSSAAATVHVVRPVSSPWREITSALVEELRLCAAECAHPTTIVELGTYGKGGRR